VKEECGKRKTLVEIDIEYIKSIAVEAGDAAVKRAEGVAVELKADASYVTEIDRDTELFVFGLPFWCVSIGLIDDGEPVAGALYMPLTGELYWGERGKGSYRNGVRLQAKNRTSFQAEDTLGFTSGAIKALDVKALPGRIRCLGSIAAEVVYTARGALCSHAGCFEGANDLAAALCIAFEAGCVATYINGDPISMVDMVKEGKTRGPFVVAPPETAALVRRYVKPVVD